MAACKGDVFKAKAPDAGAPPKGANSFTESQAKDRAVAAGYTDIATLAKDNDGIRRGSAKKGQRARERRRRLQGQRRLAVTPSHGDRS